MPKVLKKLNFMIYIIYQKLRFRTSVYEYPFLDRGTSFKKVDEDILGWPASANGQYLLLLKIKKLLFS